MFRVGLNYKLKYTYKNIHHTIKGKSHIDSGLPCQDKTYTLEANSVTAITLCDGAGSCEFAEIGAEIASKTIAEFVCENFLEIFKDA